MARARFQSTARPQFAKNEFGRNLRRMFSLFKGERKVIVFTIIFSIIEAIMVTFGTFCICVIYSNFFAKADTEEAKDFLSGN